MFEARFALEGTASSPLFRDRIDAGRQLEDGGIYPDADPPRRLPYVPCYPGICGIHITESAP